MARSDGLWGTLSTLPNSTPTITPSSFVVSASDKANLFDYRSGAEKPIGRKIKAQLPDVLDFKPKVVVANQENWTAKAILSWAVFAVVAVSLGRWFHPSWRLAERGRDSA